MSCLYIIKQNLNNFTDGERKIADYILENKDDVINFSAQELADRVDGSAAGVVRFSKKLGFKGFTNLKVELAKDNEEFNNDFNEIIREDDDIKVMVKKAITANITTLEKTSRLINFDSLSEAIEILKNSKKIYIYGIGASGLVALDFQYKLLRIKKEAIYNLDSHIQLATASIIDKEDVAIGISYSGETREVTLAIDEAKRIGAKTIAITKMGRNNKLSNSADISLYIPNEEKEMRLGAISSRISALTLIDLLYLGIVKSDISSTREHLKETRILIKNLK
ncbi:MurR/RpiR family transcriptional regulator [Clostridium perfringens]|uniref:MurR/RpiR family transcriptional regulator n=1 Tax=Clostridium perfringens TaxID=1502 RepID=UPI0039ECAE36